MPVTCPFCGGGWLEWVGDLFYFCMDCRHVVEESVVEVSVISPM